MDKSEQSKRWFSGWRSAPQAPADDPADMGTAFGLDLSMNVLHPENPEVVQARAPSWVSRWSLRRKPSL